MNWKERSRIWEKKGKKKREKEDSVPPPPLPTSPSDPIFRSPHQATVADKCFWETTHLPLPLPNIFCLLPLRAKCWVREGVGGEFPPKAWNDPKYQGFHGYITYVQ